MCNTGTKQCGQRRVRERMHRAPVCAHGCSSLSAPLCSLSPPCPLPQSPLWYPYPLRASFPFGFPSSSPRSSRRFLLFISLIPLYVPVSLTLSLFLHPYLSTYCQLSLSTGASSFSSFSLHQFFSLSLSLHFPLAHTRARIYARPLMDNRSIFFSLFPLCFSFVPSILFLFLLLLLRTSRT